MGAIPTAGALGLLRMEGITCGVAVPVVEFVGRKGVPCCAQQVVLFGRDADVAEKNICDMRKHRRREGVNAIA